MSENLHWVKYPDVKPTESGYYQTIYKNPLYEELLFKALWYSEKDGMFQGHWSWAWDREDIIVNGKPSWRAVYKPLEVREYVPESRNDYYVPCMMWEPEK